MTIPGNRGRPNAPDPNAPTLKIDKERLSDSDGMLELLRKMLVEVVLPQCRTDGTASIKQVVDATVKISKEMREHVDLAGFGERAKRITDLATRVLDARTGCSAKEVRALISEVAEAAVTDE